MARSDESKKKRADFFRKIALDRPKKDERKYREVAPGVFIKTA